MLGNYMFSADDYKRLPYLHPSYAEYGFESADLLSFFIHTGSYVFPKIYPNYGDYVEFVDIPITNRLQQNEQYSICLMKKKDCHLAIVNEKDFLLDDEQTSQWKSDGKKWTITFVPKHCGKLSLSIRDMCDKNLYHSILEYRI